jgi:hypothetical protein
MQLKINSWGDIIIEWVPYSQFSNIKEINKSDSATLYSAIWINGPLEYKRKYERKLNKEVALKCLHNSQNIINEFLNEVRNF